jgi:fatty-acyl-CoA synthase
VDKLQSSYVSGTGDVPLLGETVASILDRASRLWPDSEAVVVRHQNVRWTWRELREVVDSFAAGLLTLGLNPGDRVGVWSPNSAEWIVAQFATARAGLVLVNINPAYRLHELKHALNSVECKALITAESFKSSKYLEMLESFDEHELPYLETIILIDGDGHERYVAFEDVGRAARSSDLARINVIKSEIQFDDPINIQYTSGTTGSPKPATLTHHNVVNNAWLVGLGLQLSAKDRLCLPFPLYHCFGMVLGSLTCAVHGATLVLPSPVFDVEATLVAVEEERCTVLHGVPTMFINELEHPRFESFDLTSLRTGIMAGAPCPVELMKQVIDKMHLRDIVIAYGMTETSPVTFLTSVDDPIERRVNSVGRVLPHTEAKVVDEQGRVVRPGVAGELLTRGYCLMQGYWNDPDHTHEVIDEARWMHTGDIATIETDGYCRIVGRSKDMVIRGGENLFPREIEEFLYQHPKVDEAEVFGVSDAKYGEELCVWIKLRPGERADAEEIRAYCEGRIAHFKIPRYIRFVDEYPLTATGKVQKFVMRELMEHEIAEAEAPASEARQSASSLPGVPI